MKRHAIIFDMDGTLADTWSIGLEIAREMNMLDDSISDEDIERLRNLPVKAVLKELRIPLHRVPTLLVKVRGELTKRIVSLPVIPGIEEMLEQLQAAGFDLYVMSSNSTENVHGFLANHAIEHYFKDARGGVGVFAKTKSLKKMLKRHGLDTTATVYIGDEVRDIEAAKKVGISSIAVTWGLNGEKILREYNPTYVVSYPSEIIELSKLWSRNEAA